MLCSLFLCFHSKGKRKKERERERERKRKEKADERVKRERERERERVWMKASAFSRIKKVIRQKGVEGNRVGEMVPCRSMKKFQPSSPNFEGRRSQFSQRGCSFLNKPKVVQDGFLFVALYSVLVPYTRSRTAFEINFHCRCE